jgi:L-lactate dehydrogenase complex protein LldG
VKNSRDIILQRIREASQEKTTIPFPDVKDDQFVFPPQPEDLTILFAEEFHKAGGKFVYCSSDDEMLDALHELAQARDWHNLYCWDKELLNLFGLVDFRGIRFGKNLDKSHAAITPCELLIARTGTVMVTAHQGRTLTVFPPVHIVIARSNQVVYNLREAINTVKDKYEGKLPSMTSFITGPSRTADIEKTLVLGAHGPKEIFVFYID